MVPQAGIFPSELTALRAGGLIFAIGLIAYALVRRLALRNAEVVLLLLAGLGLALVSGTEITDKLLSTFSFEKGNGGRSATHIACENSGPLLGGWWGSLGRWSGRLGRQW